jgi:hypothetical protein
MLDYNALVKPLYQPINAKPNMSDLELDVRNTPLFADMRPPHPFRQLTFVTTVPLTWELMYSVHEYYELQKVFAYFIIINANVHTKDYVRKETNDQIGFREEDLKMMFTVVQSFADLFKHVNTMKPCMIPIDKGGAQICCAINPMCCRSNEVQGSRRPRAAGDESNVYITHLNTPVERITFTDYHRRVRWRVLV